MSICTEDIVVVFSI
jgi:hypothetical protein